MSAEGEGKNSKPAANNSMVTAVALFDKAGDLIYVGQSKGNITVLDAVSLKFLDIVKVGFCTVSCRLAHAASLLMLTASAIRSSCGLLSRHALLDMLAQAS